MVYFAGLWALLVEKNRRFDAKSCLLGCGMLLCSALSNAAYAVRDGVYAAVSTSVGTHRAATLFCMILIELSFLAGRLYAAVADPAALSVFSALTCAGIRALLLDKSMKKA